MKSENLQCHMCEKSFESSHRSFAICCKKKCSKIYCTDCITKKIDKEFDIFRVKPETWVCYACGERCTCQNCIKKNRIFLRSNKIDEPSIKLRSHSLQTKEEKEGSTKVLTRKGNLVASRATKPINEEQRLNLRSKRKYVFAKTGGVSRLNGSRGISRTNAGNMKERMQDKINKKPVLRSRSFEKKAYDEPSKPFSSANNQKKMDKDNIKKGASEIASKSGAEANGE